MLGVVIGAGLDLAWRTVRKGFLELLNWLIGKWNDMMDTISKATITVGFGKFAKTISLGAAAGFKMTEFETESFGDMWENVTQKVEEASKAYDEKMIKPWQDVVDSWEETTKEETPFDLDMDQQELKKQMADLDKEMAALKEEQLNFDAQDLEVQKEKTDELEKQRDVLLELADIAGDYYGGEDGGIFSEIKRRVGSA